MPLHDWTRVPAGLFHHFHQSWSVGIVEALNAGRLPTGTIALVEQRSGPREPDVLAIEVGARRGRLDVEAADVAILEPPVTQMVHRSDKEIYAGRANRIVIRHHLGRIVAVIEILSRYIEFGRSGASMLRFGLALRRTEMREETDVRRTEFMPFAQEKSCGNGINSLAASQRQPGMLSYA